ncbi:hypothetical protein PCC79_01810 [Propioniciclava soli]|uniref:Phenylacetate--CoA ligase family protein n=1 Tax=Propioniciclava soli TaxID=2775081 RepID=A0ABZ3C8D1_9ACTN
MSFRQAVFTLKARAVRPRTLQLYRELLANQAKPEHELAWLSQSRARAIASFAIQNTAFYRQVYSEQGITTSDLDAPETWTQLPIVDRSMIKDRPQDFQSNEFSPKTARPALTGGSTGQPVKVAHDSRVPTLALAWRMYSWWGVQPWDDLARVGRWGFGRLDNVKNVLSWWPTKQFYLDAGLIEPSSIDELLTWVAKNRPPLLEGYVGALTEVAAHLERRGDRLSGLTAVATTAAPLTEETRLRLQDAFGAPVYDEYRAAEVGWLAGECRAQEGLHINSDMRLIEVLDDNDQPVPPGEVGSIVITDLANRVFPLIRYRNGDRGRLLEGGCNCGLGLPRLGKPEGRTTDMLRTPSGKALGHRLMAMFSAQPDAVRLFQLHQAADYSITVRVVLNDQAAGAAPFVESVVEGLRKRVDYEVPVLIEYVDALPYTGGKLKYVISEVPF